MKIPLLIRLSIIPALALAAFYLNGCSSDNAEETKKLNKDLKSFREEVNREDAITSKVMEDNLDDDLNETERKAVHPIFEKNQKARERMANDVFGDQKPAE
ncbi:MAG TPA: hypothetical protein DET40_14580 [Lentisphaeria bacterium]|nr:MAG: hypothetical protein A2X45_05750 [Lentisphaerae bacterium GWF2_50_93]HCE44764.1 hypothetical protein [Lentisphaeria bacterium]